MKKKLLWIAIAALALGATACGSKDGGSTADSSKGAGSAVEGNNIKTEYGEVVLGEYKGLEVEKKVYKVSQEDVEEQVQSMLYEYVDYEVVSRASKEGDYVSVSMTGKKGSETVLDYTGDEGYEIGVGYKEFGDEFDAKMTGVSAGDHLTFSVTYAADDLNEELAGAKIDFDVTVKEVKEEKVPELTDEFVKSKLGYDSKDALYKEAEEQLKTDANGNSDAEVGENLLAIIIENSEIKDYTKEAYDNAKAEIEDNYKSYAALFGADVEAEDFDIFEMFEMTEEDIKQEILDQLYRQIIVEAIRIKENIELSDEDYQAGLTRYAEDNEYASTDELLQDYDESLIRKWLLEDKVIEFLVSNAKVTEVEASMEDEYMEDAEGGDIELDEDADIEYIDEDGDVDLDEDDADEDLEDEPEDGEDDE